MITNALESMKERFTGIYVPVTIGVNLTDFNPGWAEEIDKERLLGHSCAYFFFSDDLAFFLEEYESSSPVALLPITRENEISPYPYLPKVIVLGGDWSFNIDDKGINIKPTVFDSSVDNVITLPDLNTELSIDEAEVLLVNNTFKKRLYPILAIYQMSVKLKDFNSDEIQGAYDDNFSSFMSALELDEVYNKFKRHFIENRKIYFK